LIVNDILAGNQESFLMEIGPDGRFGREIPMYNPEEVIMEYGNSMEQLYLEPGKQLVVILGGDEVQFMGNLASVNADLQKVANLHLFDYNGVSKGPVMSPDSFRTYVFNCGKREMHIIDSLYARKEIGRKAFQVKQIQERYSYLNIAMEYHYIYHDAPPYPAGYFNFITPAIANDPLAYLSTSYYFFINRIKFLEQLRSQPFVFQLNFKEIIEGLRKAGVTLSDNDKKVYARMTSDGALIRQDSADTNADSVFKIFTTEHNAFIQKSYQRRSEAFFYSKYDSAFSLTTGSQAVNIMRSQDILAPIVEKLTPKDDSVLKEETALVGDPFIRKQIFQENERTIGQIAANKNAGGYTLNATPLVSADRLFDSIMVKYRGKLVYVDFWATWCGPCRSGMKEIAPLKEELKDKDIVFVYITNETSPEETYKNMTPTIKGEHYRLKQDDYNYLAAKFQITGIPHYVLVDKAGKVINPNMGFNFNEKLKELFEKYL
jgi:thiol-disulfide isomerase/thioredoxin